MIKKCIAFAMLLSLGQPLFSQKGGFKAIVDKILTSYEELIEYQDSIIVEKIIYNSDGKIKNKSISYGSMNFVRDSTMIVHYLKNERFAQKEYSLNCNLSESSCSVIEYNLTHGQETMSLDGDFNSVCRKALGYGLYHRVYLIDALIDIPSIDFLKEDSPNRSESFSVERENDKKYLNYNILVNFEIPENVSNNGSLELPLLHNQDSKKSSIPGKSELLIVFDVEDELVVRIESLMDGLVKSKRVTNLFPIHKK